MLHKGLATLCLSVCLLILWPVSALANTAAGSPLTELAQNAEFAGDYAKAIEFYQAHLENQPDDPARATLLIRMSILKEAGRLGYDSALPLFLEAMTARSEGNFDLAVELLHRIDQAHESSYLHDDAIYLIGYIALLDQYEFEPAHESMRKLLTLYPDSRYTDTALYSQAIALEQLGNTLGARAVFQRLRDRHTEFSISMLDKSWPKSTVLSRYWFDRADKRLDLLQERESGAARVVSQQNLSSGNGGLRVQVNLQGLDFVLLLQPSLLVRDTDFNTTEAANDQSGQPVMSRLYSGTVEGEEDSWARVSMSGEAIVGVVQRQGERFVLDADTMIGTIDYYQPASRRRSARGAQDGFDLQDYVMHPPVDGDDSSGQVYDDAVARVSDKTSSVSRLARIAVVIDSQYDAYYGGQGMTQALSALNVADGIYRDKFGLALEVISAKVITDRTTDPMNLGAVSLETMLRNFRDYRQERAADFPEASLVYLFSGNRNSDQAIGLAWIGASCRLDGFDVGVTTPSLFADLLVTHELGHSLGAEHDSDTSCSGASNQLMWPRISSNTEQDFTNCSRSNILSGLDAWCFADTLDVALEWRDTDISGVTLAVRNNDAARPVDDTRLVIDRTGIKFDELPTQCVEADQGQLTCQTGQLWPGQSLDFHFDVDAASGASMTLLAELSPVGVADVETANNSMQVNIIIDEAGRTVVQGIEVDNPATGSTVQASVEGSGGGSAAAGGSSGALSGGVVALLTLLGLPMALSRHNGVRSL